MDSFLYPAIFESEPGANGKTRVTFRDFPDVTTRGADWEDAFEAAKDAIRLAAMAWLRRSRDLPRASPRRPHEVLVPLDITIAAKAALNQAMEAGDIDNGALARMLGLRKKDVRRLRDAARKEQINQLAEALEACGKEVIVLIADRDTFRPGAKTPA